MTEWIMETVFFGLLTLLILAIITIFVYTCLTMPMFFVVCLAILAFFLLIGGIRLLNIWMRRNIGADNIPYPWEDR